MSFKNNRGDVSGYVIALVLAIVVLIVSLFVIPKIGDAQNAPSKALAKSCEIAGGECQAGPACESGTRLPAPCPPVGGTLEQSCCK